MAAPWTEDTVRQCLFLYLSLLPLNHQLVHELASVYTEAIADIKRSVLRAIEQPVSLRPPLPSSTVRSVYELWFPSNRGYLGRFYRVSRCRSSLQIRGMGMNSPELLLLVENCPKGAETLVTRCLHILTDKGEEDSPGSPKVPACQTSLPPLPVPPSPELVERVRDLYHKRVPDVRFLIPVINGLEKVKTRL